MEASPPLMNISWLGSPVDAERAVAAVAVVEGATEELHAAKADWQPQTAKSRQSCASLVLEIRLVLHWFGIWACLRRRALHPAAVPPQLTDVFWQMASHQQVLGTLLTMWRWSSILAQRTCTKTSLMRASSLRGRSQ